ncbi:MAG: transglycosylase domain-containing protein, partial [Candidatus Omnitrophica bacterium]|nr:transglycosylase domain-containing protein [Candidatus Omnitrophota bacterium]
MKNTLKHLFTISCITTTLTLSLYITILRTFPFPQEAIQNIEYSKYICDKDGHPLRAFLGQDDRWLLPVDLKELNPNLINATIAIEDRRFRDHHGVDVSAIARAIKQNLANRRVISGASTLSMQVIRILEPRKRTLPNKIIEAVHALRLESLYSKDDIL